LIQERRIHEFPNHGCSANPPEVNMLDSSLVNPSDQAIPAKFDLLIPYKESEGQRSFRIPRHYQRNESRAKRVNDRIGNEILRERAGHPSDPVLEIKRLQRCMNDLVGLMAAPAASGGREPAEILSSLLDSLMGMLTLDFIYARVVVEAGEKPLDMLRARPSHRTDEIDQFLDDWLNEDPLDRLSQTRCKIGGREISLLPMRMGVGGELGFLVAGSRRWSFPEQTESLVLSVAVNQTAAALQQVLLLREQERVARELDRRIAERTREIAKTNEELRLQVGVLQHLPVSAWTLKPDGTPDFVNQVWLEFSGQTLDFVRSNPEAWMTAVHPEDRETASRAFWDGVRSGQGFAIETRSLRAQDGTYRWHLNQAVALRDAEGKVLKFVGTTTDIDDQKRAEEELQRKEAFLADGQRLSSTGSFCRRSDTDEFVFSDEAYRIFEFVPEGPVTFKQISSRVHPDDIPLLSEKMRTPRTIGEDHDYEIRLRMLDGRIKYVHTVSHATTHQDGHLEYMGAIQDVTERRLAEEALSKLRSELAHVARVASLGVLTASIAHEVNQPLTGIVINASTLLRSLSVDPPNIDNAREAAQRMIRDGNRASEVITRLRALFSNKEATFESVNLTEAAREVITLCVDDLQRSRVILRQELANDLTTIPGDRVQLQQVILNLLRNASDAMSRVEDRPRELVIRTEKDESDCVRLTVQDAGVGITPQNMERLFDAFYTTKSDGMGMGLSVSRSIIERHNGCLCATANDGPGATFSFSIPCKVN
jgi:PAS domain S-box-containing protein